MSDNTNYVISCELSESRMITGFPSVSVGKLLANNCLALSDISVLILILTVGFFGVISPPLSIRLLINYAFTFSDVFSLFIIFIALSTKNGKLSVIFFRAISILLFNCSLTLSSERYLSTERLVIPNSLHTLSIFPACFRYTSMKFFYPSVNTVLLFFIFASRKFFSII